MCVTTRSGLGDRNRDSVFMAQFRIRDLLTLALLVSVVLVWLFKVERDVPAHVLLSAKNASANLEPVASPMGRLPPISNRELVEILNLQEWIDNPEWSGSPFSPYSGTNISIDVAWLENPVNFHWELDSKDSLSVIWDADWDAIEKQNSLANKVLVTRSILPLGAVLILIWMYKPRRTNHEGA